MPQIGWLEILSIVTIAILVLGPKEFPVALKKIGTYFGKLKNTLSSFQREVNSVTENIDIEKDIVNKKDNNKTILETLKKNKEILFAFELDLNKSKYTDRFIFNET